MKNFLAKVKAKFPARSGMTLSVGMVIGIFLVFIVGAAV